MTVGERESPTLSDDDGWHVDDDNLVFVIAQLENVFIIIINASNRYSMIPFSFNLR